jgi:signal transduction histidine kinase
MRTQRDRERLAAQLSQSRKMEAVGRLADGFTHDFNNILSGILGLTEIVVSRMLPLDSPARAYLEEILEAGGEAKARIAQIRSFGISGKGKREICRLPELLEGIVPLVEETLPAVARLSREIHWKDAAILADEAQIKQMLLNLLTNAVQALDQSPGEVVVSLSSVEFSDSPLPHPELTEGKYACLIISDTGEGIPAESLNRIFDPYFTTRKALGGKGLGLPEVYGIVRRYGGVVTVESEVCKGAVFTVYLPAISERNSEKLSRME